MELQITEGDEVTDSRMELQCPDIECTMGEDGGRYKTEKLDQSGALQLLNLHVQLNHLRQEQGAQGAQHQQPEAGGRSKQEKVPRPTLNRNISEDKYLHFHRLWLRYKRSTQMTSEVVIRDQLLSCCSDELSEELGNLFGEQLDNKSEEEILAEMRRLAVVAQNNLVNIVRLRSLIQDRDEPIRSYLARLKGISAVCKLTLRCSCNPPASVSYADKEILHCIVKGLADEDIRRQVLGVVEEMNLDDTVKFIEAKESGKKAGVYLDSDEASLHKMTGYRQAQRENLTELSTQQEVPGDSNLRCKYCGRKGHGASPGFNKKRESCPAFDKTCHKCGGLGHFSGTLACKKAAKVNKVEAEKKTQTQIGVKKVGMVVNTKGRPIKLSVSRPIPHMQEENGKMIIAMPKAHPRVRVRIEVNTEMYKQTGLQLKMRRSSMTKQGKLLQVPKVEVLCDTGAQVDCMSRKQLRLLGLLESQLLKPEVVVGCADETKAEVLGVFFGKVLAMEGLEKLEVQVLFYVLRDGGSILSRHTCEKLGLVSQDFPTLGEHLPKPSGGKKSQVNKIEEFGAETIFQDEGECDPDSTKPCRCPRREYVDPPDEIPFPPVEENREKLEMWIKEYFASSAFLGCKRQEMPCTAGPPMKIHTNPDVVPVAVHKPVPVPLHFRNEVYANIDADVKRGVLRKVPPGEPTPWCAKLVITAKKNGKPRRTVDLSGLTKAGIRETHHTRSPFKVVCSIPKGMVKTTLDCVDGYHGVPLAEEDWHKTTFLTEKGRFQYKRVPQGYGSSNDGYTIRTDEVLASVPGKPDVVDYEKIIDDVIQWSEDIGTAFHRVCSILSHCSKAGMVFSPAKFVFAKNEVEYAGFLVGLDSIQPTPSYIKNIEDFPTPKNISDIRSWFGLVNQVAYAFSKGTIMAPFRDLLKPATKFEWTSQLDKAFLDSKVEIVRLVKDGVKMFDPELVTCLSTDFCKTGLGWILQQKVCACPVISPVCCSTGWRLVLAGGRFTIPAESRYSPTEGEMLAVAAGLESSRYYTLGCKKLYIATDHKPLLSILNDRALDTIVNPRLLRIKERTLAWQFDMVYVPGNKQAAADTLSRKKSLAVLSSLSDRGSEDIDMEDILHAEVVASLMEVSIAVAASDQCQEDGLQGVAVLSVNAEPRVITWLEVQKATNEDKVLAKLREEIQRGIPDSSTDIDKDLRMFHKYRHGLVVVDGVITYKRRIVIPTVMQNRVLETLHAAHQGVSGMINRAEQSIFWPNITTDIMGVRARCRTCVRNAPSQPAGKPVAPPSPSYPFQMVATDYCHLNGNNYLVIADRYSGWLSVLFVGKGDHDSDKLIEVFRDYFATFGCAEEISSDSGAQYKSSKFEKFLQQYGVQHRLSSSYFAHSNSRAELAVKTGKRLLMDNMGPDGEVNTDKFLRAMLQYRNTPQPDTRLSPAQVVYGRYLRDFIPVVDDKYEPKQEWGMVREHRERALARRLDRDGSRLEEHTKKLEKIPVGGAVAVQNQTGRFPKKWEKTGVVVENKDYDKVVVRMDGSRRLTTRNRRFVRRIITPPDLAEVEIPGHVRAETSIENNENLTNNQDMTVAASQQYDDDQVVVEGEPDVVVQYDEDDGQQAEPGGQAEADVEEQAAQPNQPDAVRPRRNRKPNVKYSSGEYDLSLMSACRKMKGVQLSGVTMKKVKMRKNKF